jgi:hypothetical protein
MIMGEITLSFPLVTIFRTESSCGHKASILEESSESVTRLFVVTRLTKSLRVLSDTATAVPAEPSLTAPESARPTYQIVR